ncbi:MAG: penicillin-binding protein [Actinomycetota bacterium]
MSISAVRRWLCLVVLLGMAATGCAYTPPRAALAPPPLSESTLIFDVHGRLITRLEADENRENVRLSELPQHLLDAVVAIEDDRFWHHKGVDVKAILRAAVTNTESGEIKEGGSTITQQYVKNALAGNERTVNRKIREGLLAVQLERASTKERILELYLNTIFFGNGAYGVQAASQEYFGKPAAELDVSQAALLAGLIQSPIRTDPYDHPTEARARRAVVLDRMKQLDLIDDDVTTYAKAEPLLAEAKPEEARYPGAHFVEQVKRFVLDDERFGATPAARRQLLFGGGLRIQTTLDLDQQALAEQAVASVRPAPPGPDAALVSLDPKTGYVRALVGGRDFFSGGERAKLDLVDGGPGRPAGSSFKPLVLAAALQSGVTLDKVYKAPPHLTIPLPTGDWNVENYEGEAGGSATLLDATVHSYNTVYAQVIMQVGPEKAMDMARSLGVQSTLHPFPSAVLGTNDVHPIDMAAAYATFANRGIRVDPVFVTRISKTDGTIVYEHQHRQVRALDQHIADEVTYALQQVVERGTGSRAKLGLRPVAGKTGTGQEWRDAWFVGFTPDIVTAVWMGFPQQGKLSMKPPATPIRVVGGSWPAMIWHAYMDPSVANTPVHTFPEVELRTVEPPKPKPLDAATLALPRVPDVVRRSVDDAKWILASRGFVVKTVDTEAVTVVPGTVLSESPRAGTHMARGGVVTIGIATGAHMVAVPDVLGMTQERATRVLEKAGFLVDVVAQDGHAVGSVWAQSPGDGRAPEGSVVHIWVSTHVSSTTTT